MKSTYPKYKLQTWVDTGQETFSQKSLRIQYGIDMKRFKGDKWWHCAKGGEAILFDTADEASAEIAVLRSNRQPEKPDQMKQLRESAPEWARWFFVGANGDAYFAEKLTFGERIFLWMTTGKIDLIGKAAFPEKEPFAINLSTGDVHLVGADWLSFQVRRDEWDDSL